MLCTKKGFVLIVLATCSLSPQTCRSVSAATLWDQSAFHHASSSDASDFLPVNDFTLAAPSPIASFTVWLSDGSALLGGDEMANGNFTSFSGVLSWYLFLDSGGIPGALIDSGIAASPVVLDTGVDRTDNDEDIFRVSGLIDTPVLLGAGTFWFGIREGPPGQAEDGTNILWLSHDLSGAPAKLFLDGVTPGNLNEAPDIDNAFVLTDVPEPGGGLLLCIGLVALVLCRRRSSRQTGGRPQ